MTGYLYDRDHVIKRSKLAGLATGVLYKKPIDLERLKKIIHTHCAPRAAPQGDQQRAGARCRPSRPRTEPAASVNGTPDASRRPISGPGPAI